MRLFGKLFLLLASISAVPLGVTAGVVFWRSGSLQRLLASKSAEVGERSGRAGQQALYEESQRRHLDTLREKAAKLEAFYAEVRRALRAQAALTSSALREAPAEEAPPAYPAGEAAAWVADPKHPFGREIRAKKPYLVYHLAPGLTAEAAAPLVARLRRLGTLFAVNHADSAWCDSAFVGTREGLMVGYPGGHPYPPDYDPRKRVWYEKAKKGYAVRYTDMYLDAVNGTLVMSAASPVYDAKGELAAVAAMDLRLTDILERLFDLEGLPVADAVLVSRKSGKVKMWQVYQDAAGERRKVMPNFEYESPPIEDFKGGVFLKAFQAISANPHESGTLTTGVPEGVPVTDAQLTPESAFFTYALIHIETSETGKDLFYIARTPIEPVLAPARRVKTTLGAINKALAELIDRELMELSLEILALTGLVLLAALGLAFVAARSLTRPLVGMAEAVKRVGRGDLEARAPVESSDEVGEVASAINDMTRGLKEGLFVKSTFKRFVSASVVEQLLKDPEGLKVGGARRDLTVFFSDLAGFTSLAEASSPEALVALVNEYLGAMTEAIFARDGTVDKYEGDAIVAFWGAPIPQQDHALRACRAALDCIAAFERLKKGWQARGLGDFGLRIGLNTGPMVVGNVGSASRMEYTVMGDAVNLGSRLEGANKAYGTAILISEATRALAGAAVEAREVDLLAVKGKRQAVRAFELLGPAGSLSPERRAGYASYAEALEDYRAKRWDRAEKGFREALRLLGTDGPSRVFLARITAFRRQSPPEDWDGVFVLAEK